MKTRQSNIEVLRILLMLMMLYLHFIKGVLWGGEGNLMSSQPQSVQGVLYAFYVPCVVMVNAFVFISGWFGIRFSMKGFANIAFQALFLNMICFAMNFLLHGQAFSFGDIKNLFYLTGNGWFVKAYLFLFILSPILNSFVEKASKQDFSRFLWLYWGFIFIAGWLFEYSTGWIRSGYSPILFMGLYLQARYLRVYATEGVNLGKWTLKFSRRNLFFAYALPLLVAIALAYPSFFTSFPGALAKGYCSPFIVVAAGALVLLFSKLKVPSSKFINSVARSVFAVYLIQESSFCVGFYNEYARAIFLRYDGVMFALFVLAYVVVVFALCILVDQVRLFVWRRLEKRFFPV